LFTAELERRGATIFYDQDAPTIASVHNITPIDWLIYTSALPGNSPELLYARENGIRATKRDAFLASFIQEKDQRVLAVAGTHGKTTVTAMLVWCFRRLLIPVSYSVGATLSFGAGGTFEPTSRYFIYEADEYDRNFLHFWPDVSLIVSMDYDHADVYPDVDSYRDAFREFASHSRTVLTFDSVDEQVGGLADAMVLVSGQTTREDIDLAGPTIRDDATLALEALRHLWPELVSHNCGLSREFDARRIARILAEFPGASRRFEELRPNLYSDYAHHPAEVAVTVERACELADCVVIVYQPHQNLRQVQLVHDGGYGTAFDGASKVYWLPTYLVRGDFRDDAPMVLTPDQLISTLAPATRAITEQRDLDDALLAAINKHLAENSVVVGIGAGSIDEWLRQSS